MNKTINALKLAEEAQTPLKDLLRAVPKDGNDLYEEDKFCHHNIPYGRLIHEALAEIERLEALSEPVQQEPVVWTATRLWNRKDTWSCPADIEKDLLYAAPVDAKAIREERDSMWLAQMEFEQKRVRAEVEAEWIETNKALAKEIIEQRNQYLDMLAEAVDLSVKAEREACAKVCDEEAKGFEQAHLWDEEYAVKNCAAAIRGMK
jgi:hypothetical protein